MKGTIIVTGATGSMGAAAVRQLTDKGYSVIMACRNMEKADNVRKDIIVRNPSAAVYSLHLNLSDPDSIREFASTASALISDEGLELVGLFNNAGIINRSYGLTDNGIERTLATNYIGPYLLTRLLLPAMANDARIVNMVSLTCRYASVGQDLFDRPESRFSQLGTYADTKLALLLFSISLAGRLSGNARNIRVNVADPGIVNSNMLSMGRWFDPLADVLFRPFCKSPEKGVQPAINALHTGSSLMYFKGNGCKPIPEKYKSHPDIEWLWNKTAELCSLTY